MHCAWRYLHENVVVSSFRRISCERCIKKLILFLLRCCACFEVCSRYSFHFSLLHTNNLSLSLTQSRNFYDFVYFTNGKKRKSVFRRWHFLITTTTIVIIKLSFGDVCVCVVAVSIPCVRLLSRARFACSSCYVHKHHSDLRQTKHCRFV